MKTQSVLLFIQEVGEQGIGNSELRDTGQNQANRDKGQNKRQTASKNAPECSLDQRTCNTEKLQDSAGSPFGKCAARAGSQCTRVLLLLNESKTGLRVTVLASFSVFKQNKDQVSY